jgi:hypothetical protein
VSGWLGAILFLYLAYFFPGPGFYPLAQTGFFMNSLVISGKIFFRTTLMGNSGSIRDISRKKLLFIMFQAFTSTQREGYN